MRIKRGPWIFIALLVSLSLPGFAVRAAEPNSQQIKMAACNQQAGGKKGDERKAFMSDCLKHKPAAEETQQDKMKRCNHEASGKTGDERKAFMSQCLKKAGG